MLGLPDFIIVIFAGVIGLFFGSFANVMIHRVPQKLSVIKPPSACPACGKRLGVLELVPVFSWLCLRGKCHECKKKISIRYPLVELLCGLLFAAMACFSPTLSVVPLAVLAFVLLTIAFIDADTQEIPDGLVIICAIAGLAWVVGSHFFPEIVPGAPVWQNAFFGVLAGAAPLLIIDRLTILLVKKDGFGYGDVKLMAAVGLFLGWRLVLIAFFFAFMIGTVFAVYLIASGKAKRGTYMAFGPFLCTGTVLSLWFGAATLEWYLSFGVY